MAYQYWVVLLERCGSSKLNLKVQKSGWDYHIYNFIWVGKETSKTDFYLNYTSLCDHIFFGDLFLIIKESKSEC